VRLSLACLGLTAACGGTPGYASLEARYLVNQEPLDLGVVPSPLCLAVDTARGGAAWWWEPAGRDCSRRSTGPDVFPVNPVAVALVPSGAISVSFRLPVHGGPNRPSTADVSLLIERGVMRATASGAQVPIGFRADLNIPGPP
jgi:hypothetical protein